MVDIIPFPKKSKNPPRLEFKVTLGQLEEKMKSKQEKSAAMSEILSALSHEKKDNCILHPDFGED